MYLGIIYIVTHCHTHSHTHLNSPHTDLLRNQLIPERLFYISYSQADLFSNFCILITNHTPGICFQSLYQIFNLIVCYPHQPPVLLTYESPLSFLQKSTRDPIYYSLGHTKRILYSLLLFFSESFGGQFCFSISVIFRDLGQITKLSSLA